MSGITEKQKVVIVGGGLVGALNAIYFARSEKFQVTIYEKRNDIRKENHVAGRSINLSLSHRGICALKEIGLDHKILENGIPMYGRMIHRLSGSKEEVPYGIAKEHLVSIDRRLLNELLLTEAEKFPNVKIVFKCKLISVQLKNKCATFQEHEKDPIVVNYDLLVGNDGAYSRVRNSMTNQMVFNFSQEYISHGYIELYFPSSPSGDYQMELNYLHIWPRNEFMLIGLPNPGGSFTGTLFMPMELFEKTKSHEDILKFFKTNFSDAVELMGEEILVENYSRRSPSSMISVKCNPYNYEESCILMGDSAHAMVPFYGQGMNCGFEDVLLFHQILQENNYIIDGCCAKFSNVRPKDARAICDLAFYNYIEMRKLMNSRRFLLRKTIDQFLYRILPQLWMPLYTMVTFTRMPYNECMLIKKRQDKIISRVYNFFIFGSITIGLGFLAKLALESTQFKRRLFIL